MTFHDPAAMRERRRRRLAQELEEENVELASRDEPLPGDFRARLSTKR